MNFQEKLEKFYPQHIDEIVGEIFDVLKETKYEGVLIHSGEERLKFLDDASYPLKMNPHFLHLIPPLYGHPTCFIYVKLGEKRPKLFYHKELTFWCKMPEDPTGYYAKHFDIEIIKSFDEMKDLMKGKEKETLYVGEYPEMVEGMGFKGANDPDYMNKMHINRAFKTEYEKECIREASRIGIKGHKRAKELFFKGDVSELDIHLEYLKAIKAPEHRLPYDNIIAFNEAPAILHYNDYQTKKLSKSELLSFLIDAGGLFYGYASDITRTYTADPEFQSLVDSLENVKLTIIKDLKQDLPYTENHIKSHHMISQVLIDHGIVKDLKSEDIVEQKISHKFYPHGLGHFLGLQVHDVGGGRSRPPADHPYLRCTQDVKPGHVFTIEPGLYFIDFLLKELKASSEAKYLDWNKIERLSKFGGIRTEDNVIVHEDRFENATQELWD